MRSLEKKHISIFSQIIQKKISKQFYKNEHTVQSFENAVQPEKYFRVELYLHHIISPPVLCKIVHILPKIFLIFQKSDMLSTKHKITI